MSFIFAAHHQGHPNGCSVRQFAFFFSLIQMNAIFVYLISLNQFKFVEQSYIRLPENY